MTAPGPSFDIRLDLEHPWMQLNLRGGDPRETIPSLVEQHVALDDRFRPQREALIALLEGFAEDALERGAILAGLYGHAAENLPLVAHLLVFVARGEESEGSTNLDDLARDLEAWREGDIGPREVNVTDLPCGGAVRVRFLADTRRDEKGDAAALEAVQYWIPLKESADVLVVSFTTPTLAFADRMATMFDHGAESLAIRHV